MSLEELKLDSEEISSLLLVAKRTRTKNALMAEKVKIDTEMVNISIKARAAAQAKTHQGPVKNANGEPSSKKYLVELNEYAWDQSDKFVKLFVTLDGVQKLTEDDVKVTFTDKSILLLVENLNNKDYSLTINNLLHPIDVVKSYRKIKTGIIAIYMKKSAEGEKWSHLTTIEKRLKDKQDEEMKENMSGDADGAIIHLMKKMFQNGDAQTKQMIAKAWTESQEKIMSGERSMME